MDQNNTNNQQMNNPQMNNNPAAGEKTFSQDDVNRIVSSRLAQEKAKSEATLAEREKQIEKREKLLSAKEKIKDMNLPAELLDVLDVSDEAALDKALNALKDAIGNGRKDNSNKEFVPFGGNRLPIGIHEPIDNEMNNLRKAMGLKV